ncbi:MAG: hypothetical protein QXU92_04460 [Candidatus Diapherotrites archaeon]
MTQKNASKKLLLIIIAIASFLSFAYAGFGFSFSSNDYYFELYSGSKYIYTTTPYSYITYVSNVPYYYFDYPFRLYSYGTYYYFEPGWYSFGFSTMAVAPDFIYSTYAIAPDIALVNYYTIYPNTYLYYTYYPASYYYYQSSWVYYPSWVSVYAPLYYGSFYYPPQASLVGQTYQPQQEAFCNDFQFNTYDFSVEAGNSYELVFGLVNYSPKDLEVHNVRVFSNSFDLEIKNVKFDRIVKANSQGVVSFIVSVPFDAKAKNSSIELSLNGTFKDGAYCGQEDTRTIVNVSIIPKENLRETKLVLTENQNIGFTGSASFFRPKKEETQSIDWQINQTNYTQQTTQENKTMLFSNYENKITPSCENLSLQTDNLTINSDSTKTFFAVLKNYSSEDFFIQKIEILKESNYLGIEATRDNKIVFSGQEAAIRVRVFATKTENTFNEPVLLKVKGNYNSGLECTITKNFIITLVGENPQKEQIKLTLPEKSILDNDFITFSLENNSNEKVLVIVSSNDFTISPKQFEFNQKTKGERTIAINGTNLKGKIFFKVMQGNEKMFEKFMAIERQQNKNQTPITQPQETKEEKANALPENKDFSLTGLASIITENLAILGIIILGLIVFALILTKKVENKVIVN